MAKIPQSFQRGLDLIPFFSNSGKTANNFYAVNQFLRFKPSLLEKWIVNAKKCLEQPTAAYLV